MIYYLYIPSENMPKQITRDTLIGEVLYEWTVKEYEKHDRATSWYIIVGSVLSLLTLYGMFSGNFLFALVIILASIILFVQGKQEPIDVSFAITKLGLIVGNRFYQFNEIWDFYIIYDPPNVKMLYLDTKSSVRPLLRIPLINNNPIEIRKTLRNYLDEDLDQDEEPAADTFARKWLIH